MDKDDTILRLTLLIDGSLLPELLCDLGTDFLDNQSFNLFRGPLNARLLEIFDLIQNNEDLLYDTEANTLYLRCVFILLLCEQTASNTLYQTEDTVLIDNMNTLIERHFLKMLDSDEKLTKQILNYYKERLRSKCWKRQLGAVHSFDRFCELYYWTAENKLNRDLCAFLLSVTILLEEMIEPTYKELSFRLAKIILNRSCERTLRKLDINTVIYEKMFKNVLKVRSLSGTVALFDCLYKCTELMDISDYSKWNTIDDVLEEYIRRMTCEQDSDVCVRLFATFPKIASINIPTRLSLNDYINDIVINNDLDKDLNVLREQCKNADTRVTYRWAKRLLKLMLVESYRFLTCDRIALLLLRAMHVCYIICIATIPIRFCEHHLVDFCEKFTVMLMETAGTHSGNVRITQNVKEFLLTIDYHIDRESSETATNYPLAKYRANLKRALKDGCLRL